MKRPALFFFSIAMVFVVQAQKTDTLFYSVVNLGKIIGENKSWKTGPGSYNYNFYYNDRGRGPVIEATVQTSTHYKIEAQTSSGLDYYKAPFTSSFRVQHDSLLSLYNTTLKAEKDAGQQYIYNGVPAAKEIFIAALQAAPGKQIVMMGGDTAKLTTRLPFIISAHGKKIKLFLCDISYGKGSSPSFTWVDENNQYFGEVSDWSPVIKKGYEKWVDTLHAIQEKQSIPFYKNIYRQLSDALSAKIAIRDVSLFDAPNARVLPHSTVLIVNGIITATGAADDIQVPHGYTITDGKGKMMLPGLWDTHSHYNKTDGIDYLSGGITHVRDMGNMPDIEQVQQNIRLHNLTGPDISYRSGFVDKDDEYHGPVGKLVSSKAEAVQAVASFGKAGYNQLKIYSSIDTSWVKAMCDEAHRLHMRVAGHIPVHMTAGKAVQDGFDELTHLNFLVFNFFPDTIDTRKNRIKPAGRYAKTLDLESTAVKEFIRLLQQHKTVVEPTMGLYGGMFNEFPGDTAGMYKPVAGWMTEAWRQELTVNSFIDDTAWIPDYKESFTRMMQLLKLLHTNGITLLAGTDGGAQLALQYELETFVKAGIPAGEVLKIACYNPSAVFNLSLQYGSIQKGRVADFILVEGNPAENISDIRKVFMVVTNHRLFYPKKLYKYFDWSYYY